VLHHIGLPEQDASTGIEPGGQQEGGGVVDPGPELGGVVRHRDGVEIDDAVDSLAPILALDVLTDRPDEVAEMLPSRGLNTGEDAHGDGEITGRTAPVGPLVRSIS
jgi:hypothetical protein